LVLSVRSDFYQDAQAHDGLNTAVQDSQVSLGPVVTMLNDKKAGMPISKERPIPRIVAGTDLMAALRQSIEEAVKQTPAKPAVAPKGKLAAKGNPAQREILLPISGGAPAKEAPEKQAQKPDARKKAG
jgi:hypothetical protein